MLNVTMLNVTMLSVVMLNDVVPFVDVCFTHQQLDLMLNGFLLKKRKESFINVN